MTTRRGSDERDFEGREHQPSSVCDDLGNSSPETDGSSSVSINEDECEMESGSTDVVRIPLVDDLLERLNNAKLRPDPLAKGGIFSRKNGLGASPIMPVDIKFEELRQLCDLAIESFARQNSLLRITKATLPITVCADIHGQFRDLKGIFTTCGHPQSNSYLFLGDYVDRGVQGIETIAMLLCFKIKYPTRLFMLRGNHEDANTTLTYGFYDECLARFQNADVGEQLWHFFLNVFNMIPLAAVVDNRILCMHGGISPHLKDFRNIEDVRRPTLVPPYGLICDILWSDPDDKYSGWALSPRGISFTFSERVVKEFCEKHDIDLIIRGHQLTYDMIKTGYRFFAEGRLVSIFSASDYTNMKNDSCVLHISKKLRCRFTIFRPVLSSLQEQM
uniref:Serine/threonine-protein phosphatase n=1 Tax=Ascaris suum TaxID=6253 RepID=F1L664_ASCSU